MYNIACGWKIFHDLITVLYLSSLCSVFSSIVSLQVCISKNHREIKIKIVFALLRELSDNGSVKILNSVSKLWHDWTVEFNIIFVLVDSLYGGCLNSSSHFNLMNACKLKAKASTYLDFRSVSDFASIVQIVLCTAD